jgi:hypothetical protein
LALVLNLVPTPVNKQWTKIYSGGFAPDLIKVYYKARYIIFTTFTAAVSGPATPTVIVLPSQAPEPREV